MCVCACVRACVRACACVRVCVRVEIIVPDSIGPASILERSLATIVVGSTYDNRGILSIVAKLEQLSWGS